MTTDNQQASRELLPGCDYQGYEFGGGYLDSVCIDGCLHDADNCDGDGNVYLNDEDIPCPMCRPLDAIKWWTERNSMWIEDDEAPEDTEANARANAISLVTDIRKNRGVDTDLAELAAAALRQEPRHD